MRQPWLFFGSQGSPGRPWGHFGPPNPFQPHAPLTIFTIYSSSIFFLIYLLLLKVSLRLPPRRDRGRRIPEACGHMRRPWKRDGPSTSPSRGTTSRTKNCECRDRVRMCARRPRVFGLSDFEYLSTTYRLDKYSNVCCVAFSLAYRSRPACSRRCNASYI